MKLVFIKNICYNITNLLLLKKMSRKLTRSNETLSRVFKNIESSAQGSDSEDDFKGLFDGIDYDKFDIAYGDTLIEPQHWDDEPFEAIVSNPPYSIKWEGDSNPILINDQRFSPAGVLAPKSKADLAFIMHSLSWLATNGTAAIVCFPGVMYRGGAEQKIRKYLVSNNFIDFIIQLPDHLFYGTSIMVLKKSKWIIPYFSLMPQRNVLRLQTAIK